MKRVLLVRDASKLCQEVEEFLKDNNYQYDVLYADESEELPVIFPPNSCSTYTGERGFNIFRYIYQKRA